MSINFGSFVFFFLRMMNAVAFPRNVQGVRRTPIHINYLVIKNKWMKTKDSVRVIE